jgi:hypothetical protein
MPRCRLLLGAGCSSSSVVSSGGATLPRLKALVDWIPDVYSRAAAANASRAGEAVHRQAVQAAQVARARQPPDVCTVSARSGTSLYWGHASAGQESGPLFLHWPAGQQAAARACCLDGHRRGAPAAGGWRTNQKCHAACAHANHTDEKLHSPAHSAQRRRQRVGGGTAVSILFMSDGAAVYNPAPHPRLQNNSLAASRAAASTQAHQPPAQPSPDVCPSSRLLAPLPCNLAASQRGDPFHAAPCSCWSVAPQTPGGHAPCSSQPRSALTPSPPPKPHQSKYPPPRKAQDMSDP